MQLLKTVLLTAALALTFSACSEQQGEDADSTTDASLAVKNLLLICIDTVRADTFYALGKLEGDPLSKWEERGLVFTNAAAPAPWTVPSIASAFTGLWPNQHGAGLIAGFEEITVARAPPNALLSQARTIAEEARDSGFKTAAISASHWTFEPNDVDISRGFESFDKYAPTLQTLGDVFFADMVERWKEINAARGEARSLNFVHFLEAHNWHFDGERKLEKRLATFTPEQRAVYRKTAPARACEDEESMYCKRYLVYAHAVGVLRDVVAGMLDTLEANGSLQDTAIVLFADHGEEFNDHGDDNRVMPFKPPRWPYMGHGFSLYEEQLHVPLVVWHPGLEGEQIDHPVGLIDIAPSAAAWLGLDFIVPNSKAQMLHEQMARHGEPQERAIYGSHIANGEKQVSARVGPSKSIWYIPSDRTLYYDLENDPGERSPVQGSAQVMQFDRLFLEYDELQASEQSRAASFTDKQLKGLQAIGYLQGVESADELESNSHEPVDSLEPASSEEDNAQEAQQP
ncbi:MAG: sulfatase [Halioglobus sp.]|nr:sulfatase [Halioglobus sp.]